MSTDDLSIQGQILRSKAAELEVGDMTYRIGRTPDGDPICEGRLVSEADQPFQLVPPSIIPSEVMRALPR